MQRLLHDLKTYEQNPSYGRNYEPVVLLSQVYGIPEIAIYTVLSHIKETPAADTSVGTAALPHRDHNAFVFSALNWNQAQEVPFSVVVTTYPE